MAKKDTQQAQEQEFIEELRRKRREEALAKKAEKSAGLQDEREEFRKFFARINGKLKLDKSMEQVIWLHFKSAGFAQKEKFEQGIQHFGYKI